ncbi:MAG TPA: hypothetical protein VD767_07755 [Thermomicrobiales bacterium]|nr:hypothetical protein [Thermomicrobiales bacterium]
MILKLNAQLIKQVAPQLRVRNRASPEEDCQLDLVAAIKELRSLATLGLKVGLADLRLDPYFLEPDDVLVLPRLTFLPTLLVPELAVVHQPAHRRRRVWRHLNQIEPSFTRHVERLTGRDDPDLLTFFVNQSYLAYPDSFVYAGLRRSGNSLPPEPVFQSRAGHTKNVGA